MYEDDVDLDHNGGDGSHLLSVEPMYNVHSLYTLIMLVMMMMVMLLSG